ncbi:MAG: hypothetical protein JWP91_565 [Fibrobacteres bacterium]|nr:hypothetical protein [Fibrobacterota bacterium]
MKTINWIPMLAVGAAGLFVSGLVGCMGMGDVASDSNSSALQRGAAGAHDSSLDCGRHHEGINEDRDDDDDSTVSNHDRDDDDSLEVKGCDDNDDDKDSVRVGDNDDDKDSVRVGDNHGGSGDIDDKDEDHSGHDSSGVDVGEDHEGHDSSGDDDVEVVKVP